MAVLIRPRRWGKQRPPAGARINWGHPLAAGLNWVIPFNEGGGMPRELVSSSPAAAPNGFAWANGPLGIGVRLLAASSQYLSWSSAPNMFTVGSGATLVCLAAFDPTSVGAYGSFLNVDSGGHSLSIQFNSGNPLSTWIDGSTAFAMGVPPTSTPALLVARAPGVAEILPLGAAAPLSGSSTVTLTPTGGNGNQILVGTDRTLTQPVGGLFCLAAMWSRSLTDAELQWLAAEPFTFMTPPQPSRLWTPSAGAAPPVTVPGATINGSGALQPATISVTVPGATINGTGAMQTGVPSVTVPGATIGGSGAVQPGVISVTVLGATIGATGAVQAGFLPFYVSGATINATGRLNAGSPPATGLTTITITGNWQVLAPFSGPARGRISFALTAEMRNNNQAIPQRYRSVYLDASGSVPAGFQLYANDDPGTTPTGTRYFVTLDIVGRPSSSAYVTVPHNAAGGTLDLSALL